MPRYVCEGVKEYRNKKKEGKRPNSVQKLLAQRPREGLAGGKTRK